MTFVYRLFPLLSAIIVAGSFFTQFERPFDYPWIAVIGAATVPVAAFFMARGRISYADLTEKMLPTFLLLGSLAFAMLLAESQIERWAMAGVGAVAAYLSLELLFFLAFMPSRYPVNGLSRVNMAYVPLIVWYAASTSAGLMTFLHSPKWTHVAGMVFLGMVLFRTTGHPEATSEQNGRWTIVGALTGLHLGLLGAMLPVPMVVQGAAAMVVFSAMLRMRRYLYQPLPSRRQAWVEGAFAVVFMVAVFVSSRWL